MEISPRQIGTDTLGEGPGSASAFKALRSCLVPQKQKIPLHAHPQPHSAHVKIRQKPALVHLPELPALDVAPPSRSITIGAEFNIARVATLAAVGSNWKAFTCVKKLKASLS